MNTNYEYQRRTDRSVAEMQYRDEALPESSPAEAERSIVWVRPSDLATTVTVPALRRSVDVQSELVRRGRRTPAAARRAARRITRSAPIRTEPGAPTEEGLTL